MIQIFTDSGANIPPHLLSRYGIQVVNLAYTVNGSPALPAGKGFDGREFYDQMRRGAEVKTSLANVNAFHDAFSACLDQGDDLIYIGLSSGVSGTFQAARICAEELKEQYPERSVAVIDTKGASLGEGMPVLAAAELQRDGQNFETIVSAVQLKKRCMRQYFTVEDLTYLKKGGRIPASAAVLGNLLQIKPILYGSEEGKIELTEKVRGRKKSLRNLAERYRTEVADKTSAIAISHADCPEDAEYLEEKLREYGHMGETIIAMFEPVTGSHVGPGSIALFFYGEPRMEN